MKLTLNPMDNARTAIRLSLDAYGLMLDIRNRMEMAALDRLEEITGIPTPINNQYQRSVELMRIIARRRDALERDLLLRSERAVAQSGRMTRREVQKRQPPPAMTTDGTSAGAGMHVTVRQGEGQVVIPITVRNHRDTPQGVTFQATPLQEIRGEILSRARIKFQPDMMEIPGLSSATVYLELGVGPEFLPGSDYRAEIRIGGSYPRRLPFRVTVEPIDAATSA